MPDIPKFMVGHSIGGQIARMTAGMDIPRLGGVVVVASAHGDFDGDALLARPGPPTLGIREGALVSLRRRVLR